MLRHIAAALLASAAVSWTLPTTSAPARTHVAPSAAPSSAAPSSDCNDNGIEDAVDIAIGYSSDLDGNGVPDECEACGG